MEKNHDNDVLKNNISSNTAQNADKSATSSSNLLSPDNVFLPITSSLAIEEAQKNDPNVNSNPVLLNNNLTFAEESSTEGPTPDQTFSLNQVEAVVDNTAVLNPLDAQIVAQKDAIAFDNASYEPLIPIKPFQNNFSDFQANKTYNTLDVANFEAPTSSDVNTFYEAASNAEVAQKFGLKTENESLTDFDYVDIANAAEASLTPIIDDERRNQTDSNANPDFNTYTEGSLINPTGNVLINDNANGNILTVSNPGTYQGLYGTLILNADGSYVYIPKDSVTNGDDVFPYSLGNGTGSTLSIKIIPVDSTPVTPPVVVPPVVTPPPVTDPPVTPTEPTPVDPTPVTPTPVDPTPVTPPVVTPPVVTPTDPTPVDPTPVDPTPDPTPTTPPQANPDANSYLEGSNLPVTGNVLDNDTRNGSTLTVANPGTYERTYGTITINQDGTYTVNPKDPNTDPAVREAFDSNGPDQDQVTYKAVDENGVTTNSVLTITYTPNPQAQPDVNSYQEGSNTSVTGNVLDNDILNGGLLTVKTPVEYEGTYGKIVINTDGSYTVTPIDPETDPVTKDAFNNPGPHQDKVSYTAIDSDGVETSAILVITYYPDPQAQPDVNSYVEGSNLPVTGNVLDNDVRNGGDLTVKTPVEYEGTYGKIVINTDGSYTVTPKDPNTDPAVRDAFTNNGLDQDKVPYKAVDADGVETSSMLTITYTTDPKAQPDVNSYTEGSGTPVTGNVLTNDVRNGGDLMVKTSVVNYEGTYGTTSINQDGSYTVTPKDFSNVAAEDNPFNNPGSHVDQVPYTAVNADGVETSSMLTITYGPGAPVAQANSYEFDTNVTYAQSEGEGGSGTVTTDFGGINVISDPVDEDKSYDASTNPKDFDPQGSNLLVDHVTNASLMIAGKSVELIPLIGPLPQGTVAQFSFEFQGDTGTITRFSNGKVEFSSDDPQLLYGVELGQKFVYKDTYFDVNQYGIVSKTGAEFNLELDGTSVPFAQKDGATVDDSTLIVNQTPTNKTFEIIDILSNDNSPMMPDNTDAFRVVKVFLDGEAPNSTGPILTINGQNYLLKISTTGDDFPLHASTTIDGKDVSFDLTVKGIVSVTNGAEAFSTITATDDVTLSFYYLMTDGVANSINPTLVVIKFTNDRGVLTANLDTNTYLEGTPGTVIGNVLTNDTPNSEANPLKVVITPDTQNGGVQTIKGVYGDLNLSQDGSYVYTPHDPVTDPATQKALNTADLHQDIFKYQAVDLVGNTSEAKLIITVKAPPVVQLAHYGSTTQPDGASSVPIKGYTNFNTNSFPLTKETVNVSNIIDPNTGKAQDITKYLVNNITLKNNLEDLQISFQSEGAGYKNTVGWYHIQKDGTISNVKLIWDNASADGSGGNLVKGQTADLGSVSKGDQIGFFLIADGYNKNVNIDQVMQNVTDHKGFLAFADFSSGSPTFATINSTAPRLFYVSNDSNTYDGITYDGKTSDGKGYIELKSVTGDQSGIYHTAASPDINGKYALNGDGLQHSFGSLIASSKDSAVVQIGFEDLYQGGDKDYNDVVFDVILPIESINSQQADSNHINVAFTDIDGKNLTQAMVNLSKSTGGLNGDTLILSNFNLSNIADADGYYQIKNVGYDTLYIKGISTALSDTNTQIEIDIKGVDTHAHYQDIVNDLHLTNLSTLTSNANDAAGTRNFSAQVYDEDHNVSNIDNIPYIITKLTPVDTTDASGIEGNQYIHVTDPTITGKDIYGNNADNIFEVTTANNIIHAGSGNDQIIATGGGSEIHLGGGNDTVYTMGGGNKIYTDSSNAYIDAGTGANDIYIGSGKEVIAFQQANIDSSKSDANNLDTIHNPIIAGSANATVIDLSQILHNLGNYTPGVSDISKFVEIKEIPNGNGTQTTLEIDTTGNHANFTKLAILEGVSGQDSLNVFDGNYHQAIAVTQGG